MNVKQRRDKRRNYNIKENDEIEIITDELEDVVISDDKKEKKLKKREKIFLIVNIIIIIFLFLYYGYRAFYYYKREHKSEDKITLKEKLTEIANITYKGDGLYEKNNYYYYKGKDVNNYLYYSGRLFRIISIDDNIKMIEEEGVTNLVYGLNKTYDKSIVHNWLLNYLNTYKDYDIYFVKNKWCNSNIDVNNYNCDNNIEDYIGLISTKEYLDSGGVDGYLNTNSYYWTINYNQEKVYFVNSSGNINDYIKDDNNNYFSYDIRPVVTISGNILYLSGNGTKDNPYIIEDDTPSLLKSTSVGNYCVYKDMKFRITDIDEEGVSIIKIDEFEEAKSYDEGVKYLNNEFIKKLNKDDLVKKDVSVNLYNYDNQYNYNEEVVKKEKNYVTMPKIGDLFINDSNNYWLSTLSDKKINTYYVIDDNKMFYGDFKTKTYKLRPVIKLKGDIIIKEGKGTINVPFVLE